MKRAHILFLGIACFAVGLGVQAALDVDDLAQFLRENLARIARTALIALVLLAAALAIAYLWLMAKARRYLKAPGDMDAPDIVAGVLDSLSRPDGISDPSPQERRRAALVNLGAWVLRREGRLFYFNITVAVLGGLIGTATLFLLYEQNRKLDIQNRQITLQADAAIV